METEIKEILKYIDQFVYVDQTYNDMKLSKVDGKLILDYITNLQEENERLNENNQNMQKEMCKCWNKIDKAIENIDLVIELIKQQSTEDDSWILARLNGFKYILNGGDEE